MNCECGEPLGPKATVGLCRRCYQREYNARKVLKPTVNGNKPSKAYRPCGRCGRIGQADYCNACRRVMRGVEGGRGRSKYNNCLHCGTQCVNLYCSPACCGQARRVRPQDDPRVRREHREHSAPGLTKAQRSNLLRMWKAQGKPCAYCGAPATTVDHVLPLIRGGTNWEGNLTPCCRTCNSAKAGRTLVEWVHGVRLPPMVGALPTKPRREPKHKPEKLCKICGQILGPYRSTYCSDGCAYAVQVHYMRNKYRAAHGLTQDAPINAR